MDLQEVAIGIDLGTTNSCVAVFKNGRAKVLLNENGYTTTPSCVSFADRGRSVGNRALELLSVYPKNTVYSVKRLMGRIYGDSVVQEDLKTWPFKVVNSNGKPMIAIENEDRSEFYSPETISSMVLQKMKDIAETYLGQPVTKAVITVPAYFNDSQRHATRDAAQLAGLDVIRLINEPTAAALAYGYKNWKEEKTTVLVYDLGGGTFDVSILHIEGGVFEVRATGGDSHLGGDDFDNRIASKLLDEFYKKRNFQPKSTDEENLIRKFRLQRTCESAKCLLSDMEKTNIVIDDFFTLNEDEFDLNEKLMKPQFEEENMDLFERTMTITNEVMKEATMSEKDIDAVLLVGGSTKIPKIRKLLSSKFGHCVLRQAVNPDEAVAMGAAIQAAALLNLPDDKIDEMLLLDVTPMSLGTQLLGGIFGRVIPKNAKIPATYTVTRTTVEDNQSNMEFKIYQGEREIAEANHYIGQFSLIGIKPAPNHVPVVELTFELDVNGILDVIAKEKGTTGKTTARFDHNEAKLSEKEMERQMRLAEQHKEYDIKERDRLEARNNLESKARWLKYLVKNHSQELSVGESSKKQILNRAKYILSWVQSNEGKEKQEYITQKKSLEELCTSIPKEYLIPGNMSGKKHQSDEPLASRNDDSDELVQDID